MAGQRARYGSGAGVNSTLQGHLVTSAPSTPLVAAAVERYPEALRVYDPWRRSAAEPDSCAVCSWPQRQHVQVWHGVGYGWEGYRAPDDALRLARMRLRARMRGNGAAS